MPNLKQPTNRNSNRSRNELKLSKIRTVPMRYENTNYFNIEPSQEDNNKKVVRRKEPNDSLNNLDLSIDTDHLMNLKHESKVTKKNTTFDEPVNSEAQNNAENNKLIKNELSNRTYEEIIQITTLDNPELESKQQNGKTKGHYRITNQAQQGMTRLNRSSSSSNNSSKCNFNASTSNNSATRRHNNQNAAMVALETASLFSTDESLSNNSNNHATTSMYGVRLGKLSFNFYESLY